MVALLSNQLIGSTADAVGRKPVMALTHGLSLLRCVAIAASSSVWFVAAGDIVKDFTLSTMFISTAAALGDLFKSDPTQYQRFTALFMMMPPLSGTLCPLIGGFLARRSLRLPFIVGSAVFVASFTIAISVLEETCPTKDRKPFTVAGLNPLSFVRLFVNGRRATFCICHPI